MADEKELVKIGKQLEELPISINKEDEEAMELIRKAAEALKEKG